MKPNAIRGLFISVAILILSAAVVRSQQPEQWSFYQLDGGAMKVSCPVKLELTETPTTRESSVKNFVYVGTHAGVTFVATYSILEQNTDSCNSAARTTFYGSLWKTFAESLEPTLKAKAELAESKPVA